MSESPITLLCGDYREVLKDVGMVDCVITDPPYSARTHEGYRTASDYQPNADGSDCVVRGNRGNGRAMPRLRMELQYKPLDADVVSEFCASWVPRVRDWFVIFGDHVSARWWSDCLDGHGLIVFAPVPWVRVGSAPRFAADGPANACEWITIARPRGKVRVPASRPGLYECSIHDQKVVTGGKPLALMRAIVRDYSRPGDLVCDPCAGGATTLLAAAIEGRRAVGAELDPATHAKAMARIARGFTPATLFERGPDPEQTELLP